MNQIRVENKLDRPHEGSDSKIHRLIAGKTQISAAPLTVPPLHELWTDAWWGLARSSFFANLEEQHKLQILARCNQSLLTEAYFIEKSGLAYCAKMTLLAETTDVAQLYSLIGADEAKHLAWIEPYLVSELKQLPEGHFLAFLSRLIEDCSVQSLIYLVQIILEGWGLDHYQRLSKSCEDAHLAHVFASILKDEALHHKSGDLLFDANMLLPGELDQIRHALETYTDLVRVGPQMVLGVVDEVAGKLSLSDAIDLLEALQHVEESQRKLSLLKSLMSQPGLESEVMKLAQEHRFEPLSIETAAEFFLANR
ncbi:MAG TPA: ferritin-like domain-containing protein [Drouetiella sp.]